VLILFRNPWLPFLLLLFGWYVLFMVPPVKYRKHLSYFRGAALVKLPTAAFRKKARQAYSFLPLSDQDTICSAKGHSLLEDGYTQAFPQMWISDLTDEFQCLIFLAVIVFVALFTRSNLPRTISATV
jgi:hypothetical protein